jgi:hypothetical protein
LAGILFRNVTGMVVVVMMMMEEEDIEERTCVTNFLNNK